MKRKFLKGYNKFISFLLSILGIGVTFSSCDQSDTRVEYGTPYATFKVNGKVTDEADNEISGIRVEMYGDTTLTDEDGNFNVEASEFPGSADFQIIFEDIDSSENGSYQTADTVVSFVDPEFENGGDSWYEGETSTEFNIQLKEEE